MTNDLHTITAAKMFNVNPKQVTKKQREYAKLMNYFTIYSSVPQITLKAKYV